MRSILNFFRGLVLIITEIAIGIFWVTVMIAAVLACGLLFYVLVTSVM